MGIFILWIGGAGAVTAQTKYGYPAAYGLPSVEAGILTLKEGKLV